MIPLKDLVGRNQFPEWLNKNRMDGYGVEVGTYFAEYARQIATQWVGSLVTVDPYDWPANPGYVDGSRKDWKGEFGEVGAELDPEKVRAKAVENLAGLVRCRMLRKTSEEAAKDFLDESLVFAYLDGDHSLSSMRIDMPVWWAKVRRQGILCGHDFYDRDCDAQKCGVATAVWDFCEQRGLRPHVTHCSSWWIIKP